MIVFPALVEFLDNINGPHMLVIIMFQYMTVWKTQLFGGV